MLAGILYFPPISDKKMTGIARRNFGMFQKLCGDNALRNVVVVTNMWGEVDAEVGNKREAELMREDDFFKPILDKGAQMARHENTVLSAEEILRRILSNHPLPLRIQEELVEEQMMLSDTGAGEELNREFNARIKKFQEDLRILSIEKEKAIKDKDEEVRRELEEEMKGLQEKIERLQSDSERLISDHKRRITNLTGAIRDSEREKDEMFEEIYQLTEKVNRTPWRILKDWIFG